MCVLVSSLGDSWDASQIFSVPAGPDSLPGTGKSSPPVSLASLVYALVRKKIEKSSASEFLRFQLPDLMLSIIITVKKSIIINNTRRIWL